MASSPDGRGADPARAGWPHPATPTEQRSPPRWTTGAKDGVGTSATATSRVWFTLARGMVTEVFYPRAVQPNTRSLRLAVSSPRGLHVDGEGAPAVTPFAAGVPGYVVRTPAFDGRVTVTKTIFTDVARPVLFHRVRVTGDTRGLRLFALLEPHLSGDGAANDAQLGDYKGSNAIFARHGETALALLGNPGFVSGACSYVGHDDALADLRAHGYLTMERPSAISGNLLVAAELPLDAHGEAVLALAFGASADHAAQQARAALLEDIDGASARFTDEWRRFHASYPPRVTFDDPSIARLYETSVTVLRVHEDKERTGAIIASLAIPWGDAHAQPHAGGYHLVWPRDLVEASGALVAAGLEDAARATLIYLMSTQERTGEWPQNMWLDGTPDLHGLQLDEVALPILLASTLRDIGALDGLDPWPMVRRAAGFIVRSGPATPQDRWEEDGGYSPYTVAAEVAALIDAAHWATAAGEHDLARYLCETADAWNASIERWMYVSDTPAAARHGVAGYYVRLTPPEALAGDAHPFGAAPLCIPNQRCADETRPYGEIVSPDALALVRFGLRAPTDPRIEDTLVVIDQELLTVTRRGPVWHRYTLDGYGEKPDGSPHERWGVGRGWPLLTGERAHFELAAGRPERARELRRIMALQAGDTGLFPEQIWDADDIPARGLFNGRPTGSAMPLVWAHAEFLKLCRSLQDGRVFDLPRAAAARYRDGAPRSTIAPWRAAHGTRVIARGLTLRVEAPELRWVAWRVPGSERHGRAAARDPGVGIAHADLPTSRLPADAEIRFRRCTRDGESEEHAVRIGAIYALP